MKRLFVPLALLMFLFLTMFSLTTGASANGSASTTWGNIKTGADSAKLAPPIGSYIKLVVPYCPQVPPGDSDNTMNCGQASVLTCVGYAKRVCYSYPAPLIIKENEWLAKTYSDPRYLNPNGYVTGGDKIIRLEGLARDYWGYKKSAATTNYCASIDALYNELVADRPVIVEVMTNMDSTTKNGAKYHFMVLVGMRICANDTSSCVWVDDVGKSTAGRSNQYAMDIFKKSWATSGNHCVFIRPQAWP